MLYLPGAHGAVVDPPVDSNDLALGPTVATRSGERSCSSDHRPHHRSSTAYRECTRRFLVVLTEVLGWPQLPA